MKRSSLIQFAGGCLLVAGCTVLTVWLGLVVAGALLMLAAEAMERTP
jgi:hypothetical protein